MPEQIMVGLAVAVIIRQDERYLLVQLGEGKRSGLWALPGGKVDEGETVEQAAVREVKEETGYDIRLLKEFKIVHQNTTASVKHVFTAEIVGGELDFPKGEIMDARWFSFEEVENIKEKLRLEWMWNIIEEFESER